MDKEDMVHTHMHTHIEISLSYKKNEVLLLGIIRMGLEGIIQNEISQREKDKYCMILLICGILKTKMNKHNKTETES